MRRFGSGTAGFFLAGLLGATLFSVKSTPGQTQGSHNATAAVPDARAVFDQFCIKCHNQTARTAGLALDKVDLANPAANAEILEKVIVKLRAGSMPPVGNARPDPETYRALATSLEATMDRLWNAKPIPGRIGAVHRLNRAEYNNAIRDLLDLDIDVKPLLPGDETADGSFDNFADSLSISTAHLERYLSVARQVTRLAVGLPPASPTIDTFEIPLHVLQDDRQSEDLPFGSRGGMAIHYEFPVDGEYSVKVKLQRQYQDYLKGMGWPQQLDIRIDNRLVKRFDVGGKAPGRPAAESYAGAGEPGFAGDTAWERYMQVEGDAGLEVRVPVKAGPHTVGVSFVRAMFEEEGLPQPIQRGRVIGSDQVYFDYANVGSVQVGGPYAEAGPAKNTPSRRAIFVCTPKAASEERACATRILSRMARLAYRRPLTGEDVQTLVEFFDDRAQRRERASTPAFNLPWNACSSIRTSCCAFIAIPLPQRPGSRTPPTRLTDVEIASRLSFFLWSSIPDERLLALAERGQLTVPANLEKEVRRMLADPRASMSLVNNFAAQWLNLRRVPEVVVDPESYPYYDLSLMQGFQKETELFVASTVREDRAVADLIDADYTFVNERLARHYDIPGIYGSRFQRVTLPNHDQRGGLLAQGALLSTTSYPDRTSPVLRGKWLLNNILGLSVPPPPPGVDTNLGKQTGRSAENDSRAPGAASDRTHV